MDGNHVFIDLMIRRLFSFRQLFSLLSLLTYEQILVA